jgi:hypothetical protein
LAYVYVALTEKTFCGKWCRDSRAALKRGWKTVWKKKAVYP